MSYSVIWQLNGFFLHQVKTKCWPFSFGEILLPNGELHTAGHICNSGTTNFLHTQTSSIQ